MNNTFALNLPTPLKLRLNLSLKMVLILALFIILPLLSVCIFQLNLYTKEIYLLKAYEKKLNTLSQENRISEINFSAANSLEKIENYLQNQLFVKAGKVEYIQLLEGTALAK